MNAKLNKLTGSVGDGMSIFDVVDGVVSILPERVSSLLEAALGH
jgi:hypothetical protein